MLSKRTHAFFSFLLLVAALLATSPALAQSTATLQGTVSDSKGAVLPNATVLVRNRSTSSERTTQTDSDGNYQFAALPVGLYTVEVRVEGFKTQVADQVTIEVAKTVVQNFQMDVGAITEQVLVSSDVPVIETATTSVGTVINQRTVQEIPLNGRHFVDLGLLIPGSVTPPQNGFLTAPLRGQGSFAFNTAGAREDTVNFMINGVNLNDMVQNQITFQPSINTVQEFKVDNSTFSAEYGRNSGAIVNIATRSGTNEYHGEAFEFLRNEALDARNFFDARKPPFKRNQFGFNLGGPVNFPHFGEGGPMFSYNGKNKTFFFFSYEGLRQRQGLTLTSNVLTDAQRASVTNPTVLQLLPLIPRATSVDIVGGVPIARFQGSGTAPVDHRSVDTVDVSHNFSSNDRLHGYYAFQRDRRGEPNLQRQHASGFRRHAPIATANIHLERNAHLWSKPDQRSAVRLQSHKHYFHAQLAGESGRFRNQQRNRSGHRLASDEYHRLQLQHRWPSGFSAGPRRYNVSLFPIRLNYLRGNHSFKFGGGGEAFLQQQFHARHRRLHFSQRRQFPERAMANAFQVTHRRSLERDHSKCVRLLRAGQLQIASEPYARIGLALRLEHDSNRALRPVRRFRS